MKKMIFLILCTLIIKDAFAGKLLVTKNGEDIGYPSDVTYWKIGRCGSAVSNDSKNIMCLNLLSEKESPGNLCSISLSTLKDMGIDPANLGTSLVDKTVNTNIDCNKNSSGLVLSVEYSGLPK